MMNKKSKKLLLIILLLIVSLPSPILAQNRRWRQIRGKPLVQFDFNCASPSVYPRARLDKIVRAALKKDYPGIITWADRAFVFDLNGDHKVEYFVPLVCGATGNCTWGVFELNPAKLLGILNGQYLYLHKRLGRMPDLIIYGHISSSDGTLETYSFRRGQYVLLGDRYQTSVSISGEDNMPRFLKRARKGCNSLGD
jgi:hypothetical protein